MQDRMIVVYRQSRNSDESGMELGPLDVEHFPCEPDEFDAQEGVTAVEMALEVLNLKIYAEEASSYPDWQKNTWYSRTEVDNYTGAETDVSAHLVNFSDTESLEIFKAFTSR